MINHKSLLIYLLKFITAFAICYLGTLAIIGLSVNSGKNYSPFIHNYLDYVTLLRNSIISGCNSLLALFGYKTYAPNGYILRMEGGGGVAIVYSCLGYGVMSFWIAFIIANKGGWIKKLTWVLSGLLMIWIINVTRISLVLLGAHQHWQFPVFNHHTWFNIVSYTLVCILIYFYDRSGKLKPRNKNNKLRSFLNSYFGNTSSV
jgi:exosortase/archaeosortase family protein